MTSHLPPEWDDDDRMAVLFKPLPSPAHGSAVHAARLNFWTAALHRWTAATDSVMFTLQDVEQAFVRKCQTPQCLTELLTHLLQKGSLSTASSLAWREAEGGEEESWGRWGVKLLMLPPRWAWEKVRGSQPQLTPHQQLVDVMLLKRRSRELYDEFWKRNSNSSHDLPQTRPLSSVCAQLRDVLPSVSSLELAVRWLARNGLAAVAEGSDGVLYVKFAAPGCTFPSGYVLPSAETVEARLRDTCRMLEERVQQLSDLSALLRQQAKRAAANRNTTQALSLLRRRRRVEASLKTHCGALENTACCCDQLRDARVNREVLAAFRSSALALKQLLADDGSADAAAETMDELQQVLEECQDVSGSLSSAVGDEGDADELLAELDALVDEENKNNKPDDDVVRALYDLSIPDRALTTQLHNNEEDECLPPTQLS